VVLKRTGCDVLQLELNSSQFVRSERALNVSTGRGHIVSPRAGRCLVVVVKQDARAYSSVQVELMCCAVNGRALAVTCAIVGDQR